MKKKPKTGGQPNEHPGVDVSDRWDHHLYPGQHHIRFLCGRSGHSGSVQWDGDRRRLDERRILHFHGRIDLVHGIHRIDVSHWMDRWLCTFGSATCALPPQVRQVHRAGFCRGPLLLDHRTVGGGVLRGVCFVHLRCGANAGCWGCFLPISGSGSRDRCRDRDGSGVFLRDHGRHERRYLHSGCPVCGAYPGILDSGRRNFVSNDRQRDSAVGVRVARPGG